MFDEDRPMKYELGFIGGGNMAEAIVRAAVERGIVEAGKIIVSDPVASRRSMFADLQVAATESNAAVIAESRQIVLAIKPQMFPGVANLAEELKATDSDKQIIISIMAGVTVAKIEAAIGRPARVVRVMPNTPLLVGLGMSAIAIGPHAKAGDELLAMQLFSAAGEAIRVEERDLDAVTAVSGSGPAYVFYLAEAMIEAAKSLGLSDEHAALLTKQTILGAAKLMKDSTDPPQELRRKVTSPGGTTQAAVEHMESRGLKPHVVNAIKLAAERSRDLGR